MSPIELEAYLHAKIPLTRAMEVRVERCDPNGVILTAPLEPNHNHLQTAFGGSLSALATLAGYCLVWKIVDDPNCHVVVRESTAAFRRPVTSELRAVCHPPAAEALERFREDFTRKGKARIALDVVIVTEGESAVEFRGVFVAIR